ncbi:SAM-dependent methyltransferase [soil metagenome]
MSSVGLTSRWMAAARARESTRADRLFDDPFAAALAGPDGLAWLRTMDLAATTLGAGPGLFSVIRTRFFDDYLTSVMSQSRVRQIVLLAAGMDTRAFRMEWPPGTRLYELDLPEVLGAKEKLLSGTTASDTCERRTVCADLTGGSWPQALAEAGHSAEEPSLWLAEGFFLYLQDAGVHDLLDAVGAMSAPGSRLGADFINRDFLLSPSAWPFLESLSWLGSPLRFGVNEPDALLAKHGWRARAVQPGEPAADYGRWPYPVPPKGVSGLPRSFLLTADRDPAEG